MEAYANKKWSWEVVIKKDSSNVSSAKIIVWDSDSSTAVVNQTTNASGTISTQYIRQEYYTILDSSVNTDSKTPHVISCVKYGLFPFATSISFINSRKDTFFMQTNSYITESSKSTVDSYSGININHSTKEITISSNHTWNEIYDFTQANAENSPDKNFPDGIVKTSDGITYFIGSGWDLIINDNITVSTTGTVKLVFDGGSWDLNSTGAFNGIMSDGTNYRVPIKLTNIIADSIVYIKKISDNSVIYKGTVSSTSYITYYTETIDTDIIIRVRNASGAIKYKNWEVTGTVLKESGLTVQVSQVKD